MDHPVSCPAAAWRVRWRGFSRRQSSECAKCSRCARALRPEAPVLWRAAAVAALRACAGGATAACAQARTCHRRRRASAAGPVRPLRAGRRGCGLVQRGVVHHVVRSRKLTAREGLGGHRAAERGTFSERWQTRCMRLRAGWADFPCRVVSDRRWSSCPGLTGLLGGRAWRGAWRTWRRACRTWNRASKPATGASRAASLSMCVYIS